MERRVRVGATHGFLVSRYDVVVVIAVPVVPHGRPLCHLLDHLKGDALAVFCNRGRRNRKVQTAQRLAQVAARTLCQILAGIFFQNDILPLGFRKFGDGIVQPALHIRCRQRFEFKYRAAGQQCIIDVKIRVFRSRGNEGDCAVFNTFQQALLLLFVQVLDLIQIEQDASRPGQGADVFQHGLDIPRPAGSTIELMQGHAAVLSDNAGHRGFARAGGAIKNHVGDLAALDGAAENSARSQKMLLAADISQSFGAQTLRQRFIHWSFPP